MLWSQTDVGGTHLTVPQFSLCKKKKAIGLLCRLNTILHGRQEGAFAFTSPMFAATVVVPRMAAKEDG